MGPAGCCNELKIFGAKTNLPIGEKLVQKVYCNLPNDDFFLYLSYVINVDKYSLYSHIYWIFIDLCRGHSRNNG